MQAGEAPQGCDRRWREPGARRGAAAQEAVTGLGIICFYSPFLMLFVYEFEARVTARAGRLAAGRRRGPELGRRAGSCPAPLPSSGAAFWFALPAERCSDLIYASWALTRAGASAVGGAGLQRGGAERGGCEPKAQGLGAGGGPAVPLGAAGVLQPVFTRTFSSSFHLLEVVTII